MIKCFGEFISDLIETVKEKMIDIFDLNEHSNDEFSRFYSTIANPFEVLATSYKQQKLLEQTGFYVPSKSINLGRREDSTMKNGSSINIYKDVTFEYVSIYETIEKLLQDVSYQDALFAFNSSNSSKNFTMSMLYLKLSKI